VNLILFCMQKHFCLANGVSEGEASFVFNNVAQKAVKDAFKHTHYIYVVTNYT
jgi:hypothetical protein